MISNKLISKLHDPEYRRAFVASQINIGIPFQLRALLKGRGKTQEWLAERTGMLQPRISGLLNPGKTRPNIETLRRLADAFDCGLAVRFVPFGDLAEWSETFDPESFNIPSFEDDLTISEQNMTGLGAVSIYLKEAFQQATELMATLPNAPLAVRLRETERTNQVLRGVSESHFPSLSLPRLAIPGGRLQDILSGTAMTPKVTESQSTKPEMGITGSRLTLVPKNKRGRGHGRRQGRTRRDSRHAA